MLSREDKEVWSIAQPLLGKVIARIQIIVYVYKGEVQKEDGPIQITTQDNSLFLLKASHQSDRLEVSMTAWDDLFARDIDSIVEEIVETYGKFTIFDVSATSPFSSFIGAEIKALFPIVSPFGNLCGLQFSEGTQWLNFVVGGDECYVLWGWENKKLLDHQYVVQRITEEI